MATIKEDYVSFEIAKLLKEKGFNESTIAFYVNQELYVLGNVELQGRVDLCTKAPTLQMAMKWLREVHNLFITIDCGVGAYVWSIADMSNGNVILKVDAVVGSYEQACEAAIKYCLENLI